MDELRPIRSRRGKKIAGILSCIRFPNFKKTKAARVKKGQGAIQTLDSSVVSIADTLYPEILKSISMFLDSRDAFNFQTSSKGLHQSIGLAAINHKLKKNRESWNVNDYSVRMWRKIDLIILPSGHSILHRMHSIHFSCQMKDQGWGNRKGYLFIAEVDDTEWQSYSEKEKHIQSHSESAKKIREKIIFRSPISKHNSTKLQFEFKPLPGKVYTIWYCVGGGGGHALHVKDVKIRSLVYDNEF